MGNGGLTGGAVCFGGVSLFDGTELGVGRDGSFILAVGTGAWGLLGGLTGCFPAGGSFILAVGIGSCILAVKSGGDGVLLPDWLGCLSDDSFIWVVGTGRGGLAGFGDSGTGGGVSFGFETESDFATGGTGTGFELG